jgi:hypothetical protein
VQMSVPAEIRDYTRNAIGRAGQEFIELGMEQW